MLESYADRREAGAVLARLLGPYTQRDDILELALPRGGVIVGEEIARRLNAPLDLMLVRKLGVPGQEELAMGAIAAGNIQVLNTDLLHRLQIQPEQLERVITAESAELARRERAYRDEAPPPDVAGRCVILVDDGLATGATMAAAVLALRQQRASRIVVAVPVAPPEAEAIFGSDIDEFVCPLRPDPFIGVGRWYDDFSEVSDDQVRLAVAAAHAHAGHGDRHDT